MLEIGRSLVRSQLVSVNFSLIQNSSDPTMALGSSQPLTEMTTRSISWRKRRPVRSGSQDHQPSKNSVQETIRCNSTSNAPDDGRMYPKHVELKIHQLNNLVTSSWHFTLFHEEDARSNKSQVKKKTVSNERRRGLIMQSVRRFFTLSNVRF